MAKITKGSCLCGAIRWEVHGEMRPIVGCHCSQCRKQTGYFYAATAAQDTDLSITGDTLKWFRASPNTVPEAKRGFCTECGSALFWKHEAEDYTSILAGSIDGETDIRFENHIFVGDKANWYEITDGKPQRMD